MFLYRYSFLILCLFSLSILSCNPFNKERTTTPLDSLVTFSGDTLKSSSDSMVTLVSKRSDTLVPYSPVKMLISESTVTPAPARSAALFVNTGKVKPVEVVQFAKTLIGVKYKYASIDPKVGFDCSGFITYVFNHFKIHVPRASIEFTNVGKAIPVELAKAGDIILFTGTNKAERFVGHMGIVVCNDKNQLEFIHSTSGKSYGVTVTALNDYYKGRFLKTIRLFPQNDL